MTIKALKAGIVPMPPAIREPALEVDLWGLKFRNPVGLAAGFDKNAEVINACLNMGFGFVETGTVTPKSQPGNPKPRIFRDPQNEAVINRMGFPGEGMDVYKANLERFLARKNRPDGIIGINIGMNKDQTEPARDYMALIEHLGPLADYLTVNISSPNTPGLRNLQKRENLLELLGAIKEQRQKTCGDKQPPLLVKFAPDLDEKQQEEIAESVIEAGVNGIILTNTTLERPDFLPEFFRNEAGGLSGKPLNSLSTQVIRNFYRLTKGQIPIIGAGGVSSGQNAYEKIKAGASLVQLYSSLVFQGPLVVYYVKKDINKLLMVDGYNNISEAIGAES